MKVRLLFFGCFAACGLLVGGVRPAFAQTETDEEAVIAEVVRDQDSVPAVQDEVIREVLLADPTSDSGVPRVVERILYQDQVTPPADTADSVAFQVEYKARTALHLQQHMQQLSVTMKSLGRQLESLEKLENTIRAEALPSKAKLHAAAEAFGQALKEHLEELKSDESLSQLPDLIRELSVSGNGTRELLAQLAEGRAKRGQRVVDGQPLPDQILEVNQLSGEIAIDGAAVARAAANAEAQAAIAEEANVLGLAEYQQARAKLFLEQMTSNVESARALEEVVRATSLANAIKAKLQSESTKQAAEAADTVTDRMESLEARLNRIEALLEKLAADKSDE